MPGKPTHDDAPVTRAEFRVAVAEIRTAVEDLATRLAERIEQTETRLLTEFHKWASPAEMKQRSHATAFRALDLQGDAHTDSIRTLAERVEALERRAEEGRNG